MNAFLVWLGRWFAQPDKAAHGIIECVLGFVLLSALLAVGFDAAWSLLAVLSAGALVAWAKERHDKADPTRHTYDGWDAYAGTVGALLGCIVAYGLDRWVG